MTAKPLDAHGSAQPESLASAVYAYGHQQLRSRDE